MKGAHEFIESCRSRPRDIARALVARLTRDELGELVCRIQVEAAVMEEFRDMLAEDRRVSRIEGAPPSDDRFQDSVDCWLAERARKAA